MNTKDNLKFNETEKRIKEAFFKAIKGKENQQVEISKICELAGIHRTTFYGHYSDIYDLTNALAKEYVVDKSEEFILKENGMLSFLTYIKENQSFFKYYYLSGLSHLEKDFMSEKMLKDIQNYNKLVGSKNEVEGFYNEAFYREGIAAIVKRWLFRKCEDDPELIADFIVSNIKRIKGE